MHSIRDIKTDMIRRYARAYAHANPLPKDEMEFARLLYEFDQTVNGGLEKMLNHALTVQTRIQSLSTMPPFTVPRITEVPNG